MSRLKASKILSTDLPVDFITSVPLGIASKKFDTVLLSMLVYFFTVARCFIGIPKTVIGFKVKLSIDYVIVKPSKKKGRK